MSLFFIVKPALEEEHCEYENEHVGDTELNEVRHVENQVESEPVEKPKPVTIGCPKLSDDANPKPVQIACNDSGGPDEARTPSFLSIVLNSQPNKEIKLKAVNRRRKKPCKPQANIIINYFASSQKRKADGSNVPNDLYLGVAQLETHASVERDPQTTADEVYPDYKNGNKRRCIESETDGIRSLPSD